MKSLFVASVLVFFLITMGYAGPPARGPSLSNLAGVWVEEKCATALDHRFTILPYYQLIIEASKDAQTFRLHYSNNTEGVRYELLGLDRTEQAGEYAFRVGREIPWGHDSSPNPSSQPFRVRVLLSFDDMGHAKHITLPDASFGFAAPEDRFVRIAVRWSQYINRVIFAGRWKDEKGGIFSFDESGKGQRPDGVSFFYQVALTLGGSTLTTFHFEPSGRPNQNFLFKRIGNELRFFRRASFRVGSDHEDIPFLVLKKE